MSPLELFCVIMFSISMAAFAFVVIVLVAARSNDYSEMMEHKDLNKKRR